MDHNQVLVRPSPAGLATAAAAGTDTGTGTIPCAGCAGTAGDYLEPPDLSTPCCRCGGGLPLCRRCAAVGAGIGGAGADGAGSIEETKLEEAIVCASCAGFVCSTSGCSARCSDIKCEVGMGVLARCGVRVFVARFTPCLCTSRRTPGVSRAARTPP